MLGALRKLWVRRAVGKLYVKNWYDWYLWWRWTLANVFAISCAGCFAHWTRRFEWRLCVFECREWRRISNSKTFRNGDSIMLKAPFTLTKSFVREYTHWNLSQYWRLYRRNCERSFSILNWRLPDIHRDLNCPAFAQRIRWSWWWLTPLQRFFESSSMSDEVIRCDRGPRSCSPWRWSSSSRSMIPHLLSYNLFRWLAHTFDVCVVVVNQVTGNFSISRHYTRTSSPALGLAWSHCINSRVYLSRDSEIVRGIGEENVENDGAPRAHTSSRRSISLDLSPYHGSRSTNFVINKSGLAGVKELV